MVYSGRPLSDYDEAVSRAGRWLKSQQKADGSIRDDVSLWGYYTQPMALRGIGEPEAAISCLNFIKKNFLKEGGFLVHERDPNAGYTYGPAWTVIGAHMWDRLDISYPVTEWMLRFQDRASGGFFTDTEEAERGSGLIDFEATTLTGIALLAVGRRAEAQRVGDYLLRFHEQQPDPSRRYLYVWKPGKGFVDSYDQRQALFFEAARGKEKQAYWRHALVIAFLARLFLVTREPQYLRLANEHFDFLQGFPDLYATGFSHKLCWAAAILYQATREVKHLEAAKKVGDHLIGLQREDGRYHYPEVAASFEDQGLVANLDIVSQFTTWISYARWYLPELYR